VAQFSAHKARILVVDDIGTNLKVAEGLMLPYKMKIDMCFSGAEAIDAVTKNRYDLVFMDHMMPEMDGIEATKLIREKGSENLHYAELPIIALTANAVSGTKEMFLSNGFNDFLSKPIDTIKLNAILGKWIPKEKQEANNV
jgi:CheY-like chemotaxis protein